MTTDINQLISSNIPWRQREAAFEKAFPQFELIVAVIDAPTPELVEEATGALVQRLSQQKDLFRSIEQPKGGPFFAQNGLLFEPLDDLAPQMTTLTQAQRLVQVLAGDPSLARRDPGSAIRPARRSGRPDHARQYDLADDARGRRDREGECRPAGELFLARTGAGHRPQRPTTGCASWNPGDARLFGTRARPTKRPTPSAKRPTIADFASKYQARLRLTGPVPMADEEFATIKENAGLNATVTIAIVLFILWLALRWMRIIFAVFACLVVGLPITAALGTADGRHAQSDIGLFCSVVCRPRRRFRPAIQRPLSRRAARYRQPARRVAGSRAGAPARR